MAHFNPNSKRLILDFLRKYLFPLSKWREVECEASKTHFRKKFTIGFCGIGLKTGK